MLGVALVPNPSEASSKLETLRKQLLADPYFAGVPSMQAEVGKTAKLFHACNDLPEVRKEVFSLLPELGAKVQIIIRRKDQLAITTKTMFQKYGKKISANDIYDDLIKRLFKNLLHKADENRIVFARRGKSDRLKALTNAITKAKTNFEKSWDIQNNSSIQILPAHPHQYAGLQIVDYYLWAVQRLYEKGEDRFFNLLRSQYRLVMDIDDKSEKPYGQWYSDNNPLTAQKIMSSAG